MTVRNLVNEKKNSVECPTCGGDMMTTKDSRPTTFRGKRSVRRRRQCSQCEEIHTTYEVPAAVVDRIEVELKRDIMLKVLGDL